MLPLAQPRIRQRNSVGAVAVALLAVVGVAGTVAGTVAAVAAAAAAAAAVDPHHYNTEMAAS